jgi:hypothetical protein
VEWEWERECCWCCSCWPWCCGWNTLDGGREVEESMLGGDSDDEDECDDDDSEDDEGNVEEGAGAVDVVVVVVADGVWRVEGSSSVMDVTVALPIGGAATDDVGSPDAYESIKCSPVVALCV